MQYKRETEEWLIEDDPKDNPTLATKDELTLAGVVPSKEEIDSGITTEILNEIAEQVKMEKASVVANGGYYIGRYETGIKNNVAVVKANIEPYTNIGWDETYNLAKNIKAESTTTSYLCSSYAWDTAIKFIETSTEIKDYGISRENLNENWRDK